LALGHIWEWPVQLPEFVWKCYNEWLGEPVAALTVHRRNSMSLLPIQQTSSKIFSSHVLYYLTAK